MEFYTTSEQILEFQFTNASVGMFMRKYHFSVVIPKGKVLGNNPFIMYASQDKNISRVESSGPQSTPKNNPSGGFQERH